MRRKIIPYNPALKKNAVKLRNRSTYSEVKLWNQLKNFQFMGYDFDRQRPMLHYIVDFYCKDLLLVIEVDGITHHDEKVFLKDRVRDEELACYGVTVLRIDAMEVIKDIKSVLQTIEHWILDFEEVYGVPEVVRRRRGGQ